MDGSSNTCTPRLPNALARGPAPGSAAWRLWPAMPSTRSRRHCCAPPSSLNWSRNKTFIAHRNCQHPKVNGQYSPVRQEVAGHHLDQLADPEAEYPTAEEGRLRVAARGRAPRRSQQRDIEDPTNDQAPDSRL